MNRRSLKAPDSFGPVRTHCDGWPNRQFEVAGSTPYVRMALMPR